MMPITKLLVANRGEIALRIFRTAQRMGMSTVAVYSDADAQALHVRAADMALPLYGNTSADSYLRIDKILQAAAHSGADAVHPGYGFLSENAEFAQAVVDAGLTWVGPPPQAIRQLGSKASAKALALAQGVPCLPGYYGADQSDARFAQEAESIGWPLMVKATAGGGGRGMRWVQHAEQLLAALHSARSEALASFGSGELLLERALLQPRHVEVQVFADAQGQCIHLGERDCSVQRRHQKIIEESPSPAVDAALRERMGRCAVALAQAAGYVGAGTVEFLLDSAAVPESAAFFLMEMNTRLQVEHPVTEMRSGLDLVEWQLRIARGEPLPLRQEQVQWSGHAIEVRLCTEDENFAPHTGTVLHFRAPDMGAAAGAGPAFQADSASTNTSLRFDHAIECGMQVSPWYDSMLGKLIVHAPTRAEAIAQLAAALDSTELLGLPSNRAFLAACLRHAGFVSGQAVVPFLQEQAQGIRDTLQKNELSTHVLCGLQAVLLVNSESNSVSVVAATSPASAVSVSLLSPFARPVRLRHRGVLSEHLVSGPLGAPRGMVAVRVAPARWHVQQAGVDWFVEDASFEPPQGSGAAGSGSELRAPFNGKLIAVHVQAGSRVRRGDTLMVMESMKLEHSLAAPRDGVVQDLLAEPGQQIAPGQLLLRLQPLEAPL